MSTLEITQRRVLEVDDDAIIEAFPEDWVEAQKRGQSRESFIRESVGELTYGGRDDYDWTGKNLVKLIDEEFDYDWSV